MWIFIPVVMVCVYAAAGGRLRALHRLDRQRLMLESFARQADLWPDPVNGPRVQARLLGRERVAVVGGALIFSVWFPLFGILDAHRSPAATSSVLPWPFVAMFFLSAGRPLILTAQLAYDAARGRTDDGPRVARVLVPALTDYVRPTQLWAGRIIGGIVLPASAIVVGVAQRHTEGALSTAGLLAAGSAGVVLLAIVEVVAHRLVLLGQPAGSALELAWDDAFRAMQLRELYQVLSVRGLTLSFFTFAALDSSFVAIYALALIVGLAFAARGDSNSYFRRRLWPRSPDRQTA